MGLRDRVDVPKKANQFDWARRKFLEIMTSDAALRKIFVLPLCENVWPVFKEWVRIRERASRGEPIHDLFPSGPATNLQTSWENTRDRAGVSCRFHDLRHPAISRMAEAGVPDAIIMALAGHVSRSMLERYSHISLLGKRRAVEALGITLDA